MMRDQEDLGTAEIANKLGIEEINTRMRNWPALYFSGEQPRPTLGSLAAMFAFQSLEKRTKKNFANFENALKELQKNERQVAASRPSMPFRLRRRYLLRPLRMLECINFNV